MRSGEIGQASARPRRRIRERDQLMAAAGGQSRSLIKALHAYSRSVSLVTCTWSHSCLVERRTSIRRAGVVSTYLSVVSRALLSSRAVVRFTARRINEMYTSLAAWVLLVVWPRRGNARLMTVGFSRLGMLNEILTYDYGRNLVLDTGLQK